MEKLSGHLEGRVFEKIYGTVKVPDKDWKALKISYMRTVLVILPRFFT